MCIYVYVYVFKRFDCALNIKTICFFHLNFFLFVTYQNEISEIKQLGTY